jgi:hypothetical protein
MRKVKAAWEIFFPPKVEELTPKEEVKRRLRMVLVADRCGLSPASMAGEKGKKENGAALSPSSLSRDPSSVLFLLYMTTPRPYILTRSSEEISSSRTLLNVV